MVTSIKDTRDDLDAPFSERAMRHSLRLSGPFLKQVAPDPRGALLAPEPLHPIAAGRMHPTAAGLLDLSTAAGNLDPPATDPLLNQVRRPMRP